MVSELETKWLQWDGQTDLVRITKRMYVDFVHLRIHYDGNKCTTICRVQKLVKRNKNL
jgi:hypothetical protein